MGDWKRGIFKQWNHQLMIEHVVKSTNASTLFLLTPVSGHDVDLLREYQLLDSYLKDIDREDLDGNLLFVLFRPQDREFFELFLYTESAENENFVEEYDYAGGYIVLVYKIPEWLTDDFVRFKDGKYSKFSAKTKAMFKKTKKIGIKSLTTIQWDVFSKNKDLKQDLERFIGESIPDDMELYGIPDMQKETLNIQKFRHYVETTEPAATSIDATKREENGRGEGESMVHSS